MPATPGVRADADLRPDEVPVVAVRQLDREDPVRATVMNGSDGANIIAVPPSRDVARRFTKRPVDAAMVFNVAFIALPSPMVRAGARAGPGTGFTGQDA